MGCGTQTSTVTQKSEPPAQYLQAYQQIMGQAQGVAGAPLQQYQGDQVAGFAPQQQSAFNTIDQAQGLAQPYLNQAQGYLQSATSPLWQNTAQYSQNVVNGYQPTGIPQFSQATQAGYQPNNVPQYSQAAQQGFSPTNYSPMGTIDPNNINFNQNFSAGNLADPSSAQFNQNFSAGNTIDPSSIHFNQNFNPQNFSAGALAQYQSPYTKSVVDATQAQFNNQNAQQSNQLKGSAASAGAFGGDREAVMQAQLANQQQLAQAPVIAGLNNQGYAQALDEFNNQQQTGLQAQGMSSAAQQAQAQAQLAAQQQQGGFNLQAQGMGSSAQQAQYQAMLAAQQQQASYGLQAQGMGSAAQQAQLQARLSAQQQGIGQNLSGAQLNQQGFGMGQNEFNNQQQAYLQAYGMGNQQFNTQQQAALQQYGVGLGEFNTQQQQQLSANEANSWLNSQAGFGSMNLASQAQALPLAAASAQLQAGGLQQQLAQEQLNIPYEQFLQQQSYPYQTTGWLANIAEGLGGNAGGTASTTSPSGNTFSQLGGLGLAGLSLFGGFGGSSGGGGGGGAFGGNAPIMAADGGKVVPFRKRGGMIPKRGIGGGTPYSDDPLSGDVWMPHSPVSGDVMSENDHQGLALPKVPNVDVNIVPESGRTPGGGLPKSSGASAETTGGGGIGSIVGMLGEAQGLSTLFGGPGIGSVLGTGGIGGALSGAGSWLGSLLGIGGTAAGAAAGAGAAGAAGAGSLMADLLPFLFLAHNGGAVRQRGGMIPQRADGGANDNDFDMGDDQVRLTPRAVSNSDLMGFGANGDGWTPPTPAKIQQPQTDPRMALLAAGLAMAGGRSGNAFQNIAEGGLQGVKQYQSDKAAGAAQADKQAELEEANNRNTLSFQEAKARAAQMADDLDDRKTQQFNQQLNSDRDFHLNVAKASQEQAYRKSELGLRRDTLDQGRYSTPVPGMGADPATGQQVPGAWTENTRTGEMQFHPGTVIDKGGAGAASASGRESIFNSRIIQAGNAAATSAQNIMEMPMSTSAGIFGGRGQGPGLLDATKEDLANLVTGSEAQEYNTMFTGVARNLGTLETAGMATQGSLLNSMGGLALKENDTQMTKLRKMAEMRQIVDTNLEPSLSNPRMPDEQKKLVRHIIDQIDKAVPFTQHDITAFESAKNPKQTLAEFAKSQGLGRVPPPELRQPNTVYDTPGGKLKWVVGPAGSGWQTP